jgi:hypothetical protein
MKLNEKHLRFAPLLAIIMLIASCGDAPQADNAITDTVVETEETAEENDETLAKVQNIFYTVPSPMEMATILKRTGAEYDMKLLNDVKKVNDYTTAKSKALNLGIYGADLSYASIFNQNQESIIYLSCTKKLADKLGVSKAFDDNTIERMEANVENRDSLLSIVSETYYLLDAYLKENDRDHISAMVIAAGWVEGLYLATTIAAKGDASEEALVKRIAEQKLSLDNLIALVEAYNTGGQLDDIEADLDKLNTAYQDVNISKGSSGISKDENGVVTLGAKTETTISPEALAEITRLVSEIRAKYIA